MSSTYGELLRDIKFGKEYGEDPVCNFLLTKFGVITKNVGAKKKGWDLEIVGLDEKFFTNKYKTKKSAIRAHKRFLNKYGYTFEIKRDFVSDRTGNFFYEVWSNKETGNSGCMSFSKADVIVIVRRHEFIFINRGLFISWVLDNLFLQTAMSKQWVDKTTGNKKNKPFKLRASRQNTQVQGILIPIADLKTISISVFDNKE